MLLCFNAKEGGIFVRNETLNLRFEFTRVRVRDLKYNVMYKGGVQKNQVESTCLQHLCVSNLYM